MDKIWTYGEVSLTLDMADAATVERYEDAFDQLAKIEVNGPGADPIYVFLKAARPKDDATDEAIAGLRDLLKKHNLTGVVKRFHPTTTPEEIDAEIAKLL